MNDIFKNKIILLTGGTGSFGNKFTEVVLNKHDPAAIRIFSRGEKKQFDMMNKFNDDRLRFFIGDVRDKNRVHRAMGDVDIVVHAAALKQVPACEYNPIEAVRTNVDGTINIIDASIDNEVEQVMAISTDKAVHPVNFYGSTKMIAEKLFVQGNSYVSMGAKTKFSCVRYGNVIGSRGSVIPLFLKQKETGTVAVTDAEMTRFWIKLEHGVDFVIKCINEMEGGEVFVPKISSMKLMDIADAIAPEAQKKIIGIRPGEKIHEILLTKEEARHSSEFDDHFIIKPEYPFWTRKQLKKGKKLPVGFKYTSENNDKWFTKEEMMKIIEESHA